MLRRSVSDSDIHLLAGAGTQPQPHDSELPSGVLVFENTGNPTIDGNFFKSMARTIKANRAAKADADVVDEEACTHDTGYYTSDSCGQKSQYVNWIESDSSDIAELDFSLCQGSYAALSKLRRSVSDSEIHLLAGAGTPAPTVRHGHGCSPVRATTSSLASLHDSELPSAVLVSKNTGKPTIDGNFFKSMARTIKANRAAKADTDVVDEEACTDYTGNYTSDSCGQKSHYVNWIEGDAMRMRIELKVRLIHERMIAANQR
jgi:hypothetical protein